MTDEELIRFAKEFRDGILDGRDPSRTCYMVSAPLAPLLRVSGVECSIDGWQTEEENHYFVRLKDNRILDPTIDQFAGWEETPVYLGTGIPKIHCRSCPTVVLQPGTFCRECQMYWDDVDAGLFDDPVEEWYGYDDDDEG